MPEFKRIIKKEVDKFPEFKSYDEADKFLKEKYGDRILFNFSSEVDGEKIYVYEYVTNQEIFKKMREHMEKTGRNTYGPNDPETKWFFDSTQTVRVWEDGKIAVTY